MWLKLVELAFLVTLKTNTRFPETTTKNTIILKTKRSWVCSLEMVYLEIPR